MLNAAVLRIDNSVLLGITEIRGQRAKRGSGDGAVWRGYFVVPGKALRPTTGETVQLRPDDETTIPVVVTEVAGDKVHFRANGLMPSLVDSD
jgi:hypothetical protein